MLVATKSNLRIDTDDDVADLSAVLNTPGMPERIATHLRNAEIGLGSTSETIAVQLLTAVRLNHDICVLPNLTGGVLV